MWVYLRVEAQPITTAWIYHSPDLWLISLSSDWTNWTTIADKNLWATTVYNDWDTLSEANCGKYYQGGNNYWFPFIWSVTTSSSQVNASNYWPWNYYSSSTFIIRTTSPYWWDSSKNLNLRWWVTWTVAAMQWPCASWFHIPTDTERTNLINVWISLWAWNSSGGTNQKTYLKIPFAWDRYSRTWETDNVGNGAWVWLSVCVSSSNWHYFKRAAFWDDYSNVSSENSSYWYSIRPFKNEARPPYQWESWWTILYS